MPGLLARVSRQNSQTHIRHVTPVRIKGAPGLVGTVYDQVERDFGLLAPPVSLHSPSPEALAACWMILRETLIATGAVGRGAREAVAAAVSLGNRCPYCVDVHGATMHGLAASRDAEAIINDRMAAIADPDLHRVAGWARTSGQRDLARSTPVPAPAAEVPELVGVAVTFQYINRMVNIFLESSPLPPKVPAGARPRIWRVVGKVMSGVVSRHREPGDSLDLLPEAPLPVDLGWAAGNANIATAYARAAAAVDAAGRRSVPDSVRELVVAELGRWDGQPPGISRGWAADAVAGLPVADRAAGRLALLAALASYQVDDSVIEEFRRDGRDDRTLIELAAWSSLTAARQVGAWARIDRAGSTGTADDIAPL
ncbi:AhpD family alkylhydroperoxidase [Allocatelliglobosispora scoriae]|uniref:AhpD family alkylhydroperoxidase n=1 Tax=Allocatelliglobosispora scoriae TaxID=643052 RepID=A0A841BT35_9ACTN|nr:carboxymuconolactone decarboxylase family protein [Allocatelliglobosispora scoriae]MBB5870083.1 AhpD family alkylhydroperoxidase [Allocatelliglobosispora scoriae]